MKNNKMEMKENVKEKLSEHFTLAELTKTNTNLKNVPNEVQIKNLKRLCGWLEKLRSRYNERLTSNRRRLPPRPSERGWG